MVQVIAFGEQVPFDFDWPRGFWREWKGHISQKKYTLTVYTSLLPGLHLFICCRHRKLTTPIKIYVMSHDLKLPMLIWFLPPLQVCLVQYPYVFILNFVSVCLYYFKFFFTGDNPANMPYPHLQQPCWNSNKANQVSIFYFLIFFVKIAHYLKIIYYYRICATSSLRIAIHRQWSDCLVPHKCRFRPPCLLIWWCLMVRIINM